MQKQQQQMYKANWRVWHARKALHSLPILIMTLTSLVYEGVGVSEGLGVGLCVCWYREGCVETGRKWCTAFIFRHA